MADLARLGIVVDSSQVTRADKRLDRMRRTGARTESRLQSFGRSSRRVGRILSTGLTAPLLAVAGASVKVASDFEESMTRVNTLVGLSQERVAGMREEVLELSGETAQSPRELSEALFTVTSAGARGEEALKILEQSAKASAIGLGETREIARSTTAVMQAYGKETINASEATNVLTATVREGNLEASDLAPVLGRVIGIASQLGISFQEVGANIATMTRLGVKADEAVTSLRGIMNALLKPTSEASKVIQDQLNMSFTELRDLVEKDGLSSVLIDLVHGFEGNEEALSKVIPRVRALSNVLGTAGAQSETYNQIMENMRGELNLVDEGFADVSETASFQFQQTMAVLEKTAINFGSALLPIAIDVSNFVEDVVDAYNDLSESGRETAHLIAGLFGAGGPVILAMGAMAGAISAISAPVAGMVGAVVGASTLIIRNWSEIEAYFTDGGGAQMWDVMREKGETALETVMDLFDSVVDFTEAVWDKWGDSIIHITKESFTIITDTIEAGLDTIGFALDVFTLAFTGDWDEFLSNNEERAKRFRENIESVLDFSDVKIVQWIDAVTPSTGQDGFIMRQYKESIEESKRETEELNKELMDTLGWVDNLFGANGSFKPDAEAPEDVIIPAKLPSAEQLLRDVKIDDSGPIKVPAIVDVKNVENARRIIEPVELLDQAMLGLPVSMNQVDTALDQLDEKLRSAMSQDQRDRIQGLINKLEDLRDELENNGEEADNTKEDVKELDRLTSGLNFTFQSAFEDAIIEGESFRDVLQGILDDIIRLTARMSVTKPLANAFSDWLGSFVGGAIGGGDGGQTSSARGNVFGGGSLIDSRETKSFANGGTGLFGEAGLEGVFPLTRMANGDLGIKAEGGGSEVNVTVINNADNSEATVEESKRPNGGRDISVIIDEITAENIRKGGKTSKALKATLGAKRQPRIRG